MGRFLEAWLDVVMGPETEQKLVFTQEQLDKMLERDSSGALLFDGPYPIRVLLLRWGDARDSAKAQEREALSLEMDAGKLRETAKLRQAQADECMRAIEKLAADPGHTDG